MRWTDKFIGFVSTLILARLLAPEDIGIIAMASLVIGFIDVFLDLGVNIALIQNRNAAPAHFNSAWTLRLAQSATAAVLIVLASSAAATYFKDARVESVLHVMALGLIVASFENIGIVTFQKEMKFGLEFRFLFSKRIVGFLVTITAAWFLRDYWALVIGALAGRIGDRWSLGFVAETEQQVVEHLNSHLSRLPAADQLSRAILEQMREDEARHAHEALAAGGAELPLPVRMVMKGVSKVMTQTTYWV